MWAGCCRDNKDPKQPCRLGRQQRITQHRQLPRHKRRPSQLPRSWSPLQLANSTSTYASHRQGHGCGSRQHTPDSGKSQSSASDAVPSIPGSHRPGGPEHAPNVGGPAPVPNQEARPPTAPSGETGLPQGQAIQAEVEAVELPICLICQDAVILSNCFEFQTNDCVVLNCQIVLSSIDNCVVLN